MALERNKQIDRQIAATRAKQQQKETEQGRIGQVDDIKEPEPQVERTELTAGGTASNVGTSIGGSDKNPDAKSENVSQQEGHVTSEEIPVTTSEIVVNLEGQENVKNEGRSKNMLVDVSLDVGDHDRQDPSVLLVQPAGPV